MKILQINNCHYRRGGADIVYLDTGALLSTKGHNVSYFSSDSPHNEQTPFSKYFVEYINPLKSNLLTQIKIAPKKLYSIETKRKLSQLLDEVKPDVAHIHLYKGDLTAALIVTLKKFNIPTVLTLHDYSLICPRNILINGENQICEKCISGTTLNCVLKRCNRKNLFYSTLNFLEFNVNNTLLKPEKHFDKIICVSKFNLNKHYEARPKLRSKLIHLYNFSPIIQSTLPNNKKGSYMLFFGRLSPEKGVTTLLEAIGKINEPINLKIVGTGELLTELREKNKNPGIEFLGYKSGYELTTIINNASFIIVPSEWYENNPMTIIEAYANGKPVIGSRIGGIPEIVIDNKTGYTFEMKNIEMLAQKIVLAQNMSDESYHIMSQNARRFAEANFSAETHYKSLMNIYTEAVNTKTDA